MDSLLQMSDNLLVKLINYEKILDHTTRLDKHLNHLYKQWRENLRNDLLLVRIYTTTSTCEIYHQLRDDKWAEIQDLSETISLTAVSIGYTSYQNLIEQRTNPTHTLPDASLVTQVWTTTDLCYTRKD